MDNGLVLDTATGEITFAESLNPYCSGQWSRTFDRKEYTVTPDGVLILIVVDNGLVLLVR